MPVYISIHICLALTTARNQGDHLRIAWELKLTDSRLFSIENGQHLLCYNRKNGESDSIEFIETTPKATHAQTLEDLRTI